MSNLVRCSGGSVKTRGHRPAPIESLTEPSMRLHISTLLFVLSLPAAAADSILLVCFARTKLRRSAAILLLLYTFSIPAHAQRRRIITPIDSTQRTMLHGTVDPRLRTATDRGPVDPSFAMNRMILMLGDDDESAREITTFIDTLHDRRSPNYQQWLTPEEFGRKFGPAPVDVEQVRGWLEREGLRLGSVARSGRWLEFSGDAARVETAFHTHLRRYEVAGETHFANDSEISIPTALAPVITGVSPLHDFARRRPRVGPRLSNLAPRSVVDGQHRLAPADFAKIYNLNPLYQAGITGAGVTIGIASVGTMDPADAVTFQQVFGLPVHAPTLIVNGPDPGPAAEVESVLDVEWSGAVAPGAAIVLVATDGPNLSGEVLSSAYIVDQNLADVLSLSYGGCEDSLGSLNAFFNLIWQQAAAQGISVVVSSGDDGPFTCGSAANASVNGFASTPFNTAVGGIQFDEHGNDSTYWSANGAALGYIPETAWNERLVAIGGGHEAVTGGGPSALYPKPAWKNLSIPGMLNDGARDLPDVSLPAAFVHDTHIICMWGSCRYSPQGSTIAGPPFPFGGGTSAAAPTFAGIMALIVQRTGRRQGLANYVLYSLASHQNYANCNSSQLTNPSVVSNCIFYDITTGDSSIGSYPVAFRQGFLSTTGYDLTTGLGSINAANLVNAWVAQVAGFRATVTTLSSTLGNAISIAHGQTVPFTVQVRPAAGSGVPTGTVEFATAAGAPGGSGVLSGGTYTGSIQTLPAGSYSLSAVYPGDGVFGGSRSNSIPVTISRESSSIVLQVEQSGAGYRFHTSVTGATGISNPRGIVTLLNGGAVLTAKSSGSTGQSYFYVCTDAVTLCLSGGPHVFTARYEGDVNLAPSTSAPVNVAVSAPAVIAESFSPAVIPVNGSARLTFTVSNPNPAPLGGVHFSDPLPGGLLIANPNGLTGTCGGSIGATASRTMVTLDGVTLPAGGSCTFSVRIQGLSAGTKANRLAPVDSLPSFDYLNSSYSAEVPAADSLTSATLTVVAPPGIVLAASGLLVVAKPNSGRLDLYDSNGTARSSIGTRGTAAGQLDNPMGIAIAANQDIWVADSGNHRIQVFDRNGAFRFRFGSAGSGAGQFHNPAAIALGPGGSVWVADTGNDRVQLFDGNGTYRAQLGGTGSGRGQFQSPAAIAVDAAGNVLVVDSGNDRVQVFDPNGGYRFSLGSAGSGSGQFHQPSALAIAANGDILVADTGNGRVQRFDPQGTFRGSVGAGQLQSPVGIGNAAGGGLAVFDSGSHRIAFYDSGGVYRYAVSAGAPVPVDLTSAYNTYGIRANGEFLADANFGFVPSLVNFGEDSYSANLLGVSRSWNNVEFPIAPTAALNVVAAAGNTVALPAGKFSQLLVLGSAAGTSVLLGLGDANQDSLSFRVRYTDGTSTVFTQGMSDWLFPHFYSGEWAAVTMRYFVLPINPSGIVAATTRVYGYSFALDPGKTVASVTLPEKVDTDFLGQASVAKILAITLVP